MAKNLQEFVVDKVCHYLDQQNNEMKKLQDQLKKTKELLQAYIDPTDHTKCHDSDCEALYVIDNRYSDIYLGCSDMKYCDRCNKMFCDLHIDVHKDDCVCIYEWQTCCACVEEEDEWN